MTDTSPAPLRPRRASATAAAACALLALLMSACAITEPVPAMRSLDTPAIQAVHSAYVRCARVSLVPLRRATPGAEPIDLAVAAEAQCAGQRDALAEVVAHANRGHRDAATFAAEHVHVTQQRLITLLALSAQQLPMPAQQRAR